MLGTLFFALIAIGGAASFVGTLAGGALITSSLTERVMNAIAFVLLLFALTVSLKWISVRSAVINIRLIRLLNFFHCFDVDTRKDISFIRCLADDSFYFYPFIRLELF